MDVRSVIREPLFHFLVVGGALFALHGWFGTAAAAPGVRPEIRITAADVAWIAESWGRQRLRPPDADELRGLVREFLREELLAREARALGLDRSDTVVRRRLAQKMEFLDEDLLAAASPREEELRRLWDEDPARRTGPAKASFAQRVFRRDRTGGDAEGAAREAVGSLARRDTGIDLDALGDPSMLPGECADEELRAIAAQFGDAFAKAVFEAPPGKWSGPVESPYGFHAVIVTSRSGGAARTFEESAAELTEEWRRRRRAAAAQERFDALLAGVEVVADPAIGPLLPEGARTTDDPR